LEDWELRDKIKQICNTNYPPTTKDENKNDWKELRDRYFSECTHKPENGFVITQHSISPNDTFEWFRSNIAILKIK